MCVDRSLYLSVTSYLRPSNFMVFCISAYKQNFRESSRTYNESTLVPFFFTDDAKQALAHLGLTGYDYHTGQLWVLSGQKGYGKDIPGKVEFKHGYESVELRVETTQGIVQYDNVINWPEKKLKCVFMNVLQWRI